MKDKNNHNFDKENTVQLDKKIDDPIVEADSVEVEKKQYKSLTKRERLKLIKQNKKQQNKKGNKKADSKKLEKMQNKKKNKKSDRQVLSYEDLPLEDKNADRFESSAPSKKNRKSLLKAFIIVALLIVVVFAFANSDQLTFNNIKNFVMYGVLNIRSEEQFPHSTEGDEIDNGNFTRIDNNLVYLSDTQFNVINNYGRYEYNSKQAFTKPVLVTAGDSDLSLCYDLDGLSYSINDLNSTLYSGKTQDKIRIGDISKKGVYAFVTQKDGYLSKLYVYSKDNKPIYAYSFSDYYITSVSLDSSGKTAVLSGFSAHDGSQISAVYVLDFSEEQPVYFKEFNENVIYHVEHLSNKYACIIGENATYTLNVKNGEFTNTGYGGKTLTGFTVNTDTNTYSISLSRSADGRMCDILNFSTSGELKSTINTDLTVTSLSTYKNRVAALSDGKIYLYSKNGKLISTTEAGLNPHAVVLYSKKDAYILAVNEIRRLDL